MKKTFVQYFVIYIFLVSSIIYNGCRPRADIDNSDIIIVKNTQANYNLETSELLVQEILDMNFCDSITDVDNIIIEIFDLNGTWLSDWYYRTGRSYQLEERELSWGIAISAIYSSFDIDITADRPFIHPPGIRPFSIINIEQHKQNSITLRVNAPDVSADWFSEIFFHFEDKDTLRIDGEMFSIFYYEDGQMINPFGGVEIWHRLSGPNR
jgi:hypothetical protein